MNAQTENSRGLVEQIIVAHPFFKGLNPRYVHLLTDCASLERFGLDQDIFRENESADHFYLIHHGRVVLETFVPRVGAATIQTIGPGEALGWSWFYPPYLWQFSARVIDPVEAIALGAASLRDKAEENHDFGYELARRVGGVMLQRLQRTRRELVDFYTRDATHIKVHSARWHLPHDPGDSG